MRTLKPKPLNTQIYSEASDWLVEFRSGDIDPAGRKEFYAWLRTSPEHMRAYLELAAIWNEGAGLDPDRVFDDTLLMRDIRSGANIVPLEFAEPSATTVSSGANAARPARRGFASSIRWALAASLLAIVAGTGGWFYWQRGVYSTGIGEQHVLALSDGSSIELNARSKVRVRFSSRERSIELIEGQAFFHVAKDKNRPLVVTSEETRVRAVGTQFDVYRKQRGTVVTVVEGRVSLPKFFLDAGEQAIITARVAVKQAKPDVPAATAWIQGRLLFQGTALQEVADEFNRYNPRRLVIRDRELANFRITGVFSSTDPSSFIRFLEARPGIAVIPDGNEILVSRKPQIP